MDTPARILVTPRSVTAGGHPALVRLADAGYDVVFSTPGQQPLPDELVRLLPGCVGYLAGVEAITAPVLEAARDLKVISRNGVGIDNIDLTAAKRRGIVVCRTLGANARGVAELTLAHLLALARWIPYSDQQIKGGGWKRRKGFELAGRTLGLIGCGSIGRLVARFAVGLDMRVLACDPAPDKSFAPAPQFRYAALDEVLTTADVLSLHCPAPAAGQPLIDAARLAQMKQGVFLINTARAELVDGAALLAALQEGHVAGAALDVFATEPPANDPLAAHDRVIASPHLGGFTDESVDRSVVMAVDNLLDALAPNA